VTKVIITQVTKVIITQVTKVIITQVTKVIAMTVQSTHRVPSGMGTMSQTILTAPTPRRTKALPPTHLIQANTITNTRPALKPQATPRAEGHPCSSSTQPGAAVSGAQPLKAQGVPGLLLDIDSCTERVSRILWQRMPLP